MSISGTDAIGISVHSIGIRYTGTDCVTIIRCCIPCTHRVCIPILSIGIPDAICYCISIVSLSIPDTVGGRIPIIRIGISYAISYGYFRFAEALRAPLWLRNIYESVGIGISYAIGYGVPVLSRCVSDTISGSIYRSGLVFYKWEVPDRNLLP